MIADEGRSSSAEQSRRQEKMASEVQSTILLLPRQGVPAI
jgi:hypothetical protein